MKCSKILLPDANWAEEGICANNIYNSFFTRQFEGFSFILSIFHKDGSLV